MLNPSVMQPERQQKILIPLCQPSLYQIDEASNVTYSSMITLRVNVAHIHFSFHISSDPCTVLYSIRYNHIKQSNTHILKARKSEHLLK